ncbi:MAG TPA: ComF family protein [Mesorhizobium sp.]|nr:ComF family protein [Mesorhizobium sp.]
MASIAFHALVLIGQAGRILFPPTCPGCRRHVAAPGTLCPRCWGGLRFLEKPWCAVLGTPFLYEVEEGALSPQAIAQPPVFDRARAAVAYRGAAARIARALKYADRTDLAPPMARWMARAGAEVIAEADLIVAVPLHWRRFWERRFNQSAELARALARETGLPFEPDAVTRKRRTRPQVGLSRAERERNLRGAFAVPAEAAPRLRGKRVLLVDDVFTTGATVNAVARALKRAGASGVDVLAFAMVLPGEAWEDDVAGGFWGGPEESI